MRRGFWTIGGGLVLLIGCSAKVLTVGAGPAQTAPSNDTDASAGGTPSGPGSDVVWTGYLESYSLPSGSDVVSMTIRTAMDGTVSGTAHFGTLPLLAPPTDPNVGYPPPLGDGGFLYGEADNYEHFDFTILDGTVDGTRLRFSLFSEEIFAQWCAIQTTIYPYYNGGGIPDGGLLGYGCLPNVGTGCPEGSNAPTCCYTPADGVVTPIDCGKLSLCEDLENPCTCTATHCGVVMKPGNISFDLQVSDKAIDGSVLGLPVQNSGIVNGQPINVHFTRGS